MNLQKELENAFDAGSAHAIGSYKDFKQTHPNKQEYVFSALERINNGKITCDSHIQKQ